MRLSNITSGRDIRADIRFVSALSTIEKQCPKSDTVFLRFWHRWPIAGDSEARNLRREKTDSSLTTPKLHPKEQTPFLGDPGLKTARGARSFRMTLGIAVLAVLTIQTMERLKAKT